MTLDAALVLADPAQPDATARAVGAARALAGRVHLLTPPEDAVAEDIAPALAAHMEQGGYGALLAPATAHGRDVLPRAAALLSAPFVEGATRIVGAQTFARPAHAGAVVQTVRTSGAPVVLTVRPHAFAPGEPDAAEPLEVVPSGLAQRGAATRAPGPDLASARAVVVGGVPLGDAGAFALIPTLAQALGGAPGATRDAVDAGHAPNAWQVGQTGATVAPEVYVGAAVSGAVQHVCGMREAGIIIAINTDPAAPLCAMADYVWAADAREALPALTKAMADSP
jgi:electron transfer flavoprotein alpha subunit